MCCITRIGSLQSLLLKSYLQTQENDEGIKSKSGRLAVAAIDFGTTYSGYAFSWKHDWSKVHTNQWNADSFMSSKAPTTLLLYPDKKFFAFGYEAENIYRESAEKVATDSDSESESDDKKKPKFDCKDLYFFQRFKMLLHENKVSMFLYIYINTEADEIIFG